MFEVRKAVWLAPRVRLLEVRAPRVVLRHQPGHFVIVRVRENGERIPLTIASSDKGSGCITLVVQIVGATTEMLCNLEAGEHMANVVGPLGKPTEIENFGHAVLLGGGVGTAVIYPQAEALKKAGNRVSAIIGGRSREYVIFEEALAEHCDAVYPCTDDGSHGYHGFVTGKLKDLLDDPTQSIGAVLMAGPVPMMGAVAEVTRPYRVRTIASLNPIMVDGTGMCGGCRVSVGTETRFACVDGPEFDAHQVDFKELSERLATYKIHEKEAWDGLHREKECRLNAETPCAGRQMEQAEAAR